MSEIIIILTMILIITTLYVTIKKTLDIINDLQSKFITIVGEETITLNIDMIRSIRITQNYAVIELDNDANELISFKSDEDRNEFIRTLQKYIVIETHSSV